MKLSFKKIGTLEHGVVELADLTILCGENNTGKTYVTYLLYCLLKAWKRLVNLNLQREFVELRKNGVVKIDIQEKIVKLWPEISSKVLERFKSEFPEMLASRSELFSETDLAFELLLNDAWKEKAYVRELRSGKDKLLVTITKPPSSVEVEIAALKVEELSGFALGPLGEFIEEALLDMLLAESLPNVFMASTERTGATIFRKQLNLASSRIVDLLNQAHKEGGEVLTPHKVFETIYGNSGYALPVRDNVMFINQLPNADTEEGELFKSTPSLISSLENIVGGRYMTNKDGMTQFQPSGTKLKLGLGEVSSSVRSLLIVWYWLKYEAKKGDLLMMDEPELNLHPANQRRLARFIATLINNGIKVFITTHSDYIVKELNTLIMLNREDAELDLIRTKFGYAKEDRLAADRVSLYMVRDIQDKRRKTPARTLEKATISPTLGIETPSFDETIDEMNAVQEAVYYSYSHADAVA